MTAGPTAPYRIRPSVVRDGLAGQCGAENGPVVYARLVLAPGRTRRWWQRHVGRHSGGFLGFEGKQGGYFIMFCCCGVAYILAWTIMKLLVPKYKPVEM